MSKIKRVNFTKMPVPSKPGPKVISYEEGFKKMVGGSEKSEGSSDFKGEVKSPGKGC